MEILERKEQVELKISELNKYQPKYLVPAIANLSIDRASKDELILRYVSIDKEHKACKELKLKKVSNGYPIKDWIKDLKTRAKVLNTQKKLVKLNDLLYDLTANMSEEEKRYELLLSSNNVLNNIDKVQR